MFRELSSWLSLLYTKWGKVSVFSQAAVALEIILKKILENICIATSGAIHSLHCNSNITLTEAAQNCLYQGNKA